MSFEIKPGCRFNRLTVRAYKEAIKSHHFWICVCDCGTEIVVRADGLLRQGVKSCGCLKSYLNRERFTTHGLSQSKTYRKWLSMKERCRADATGKARDNYLLRGIKICERWKSFESFLADMGECPMGMEIDRINNDGNYEPGNCRWGTRLENQHNRRVSINVEFQGRTQTLKQWASELGLRYVTLIYRIKTGWPIDRAFTTKGRNELAH